MNIKFRNKEFVTRNVLTYPSRFKIGDFLVGPDGMILKVATVQPDCPIWESNTHTKTVVLFETENGMLIPAADLSGKYKVLRPRS